MTYELIENNENMILNKDWIGKTLKKVIELGKDLIRNTKNHKYHFRRSWLYDLLEYYSQRPGKPLIHLEDLPDKVCISFTEEGKKEISRKLYKIIVNRNKRELMRIFGSGLFYYLSGRTKSVSIAHLRKIIERLELSFNDLEKYVVTLKPSSNSKIIKINKMPINMLSKDGAIILGSFPDIGVHRYVLSCKDVELIDEFRKASHNLLGNFKDHQPQLNNGMTRYYATNLLRDVCNTAGYDTDIKQVITNNPLPLWVFSSPAHFLSLCLRKMWDTDGTIGKKDKKLKFSQTVVTDFGLFTNSIKSSGERDTSFRDLHREIKIILLDNPPRLIVTMQLALKMMGIESRIYPERAYITKDKICHCEWSLRITSYKNIQNFTKKVGFGLGRKKRNLEILLKSYKRIQTKKKHYFTLLKEIRRRGFITNRKAAKVLTLSQASAYLYLTKLRNEGFISFERKKLKRGKYLPSGYVYKPTEEGEKVFRVM